MAKLLIHESAGIREFELVDEEVRIGRELDNALRLPDPSVSRHHAVLMRTPEGYVLQDKNSSNGVYVNDERAEETTLSDGDEITLGQIQITFQNTDGD
jgi:pSer/pThr/pTyr-binding forkhead associated (FHA) protein